MAVLGITFTIRAALPSPFAFRYLSTRHSIQSRPLALVHLDSRVVGVGGSAPFISFFGSELSLTANLRFVQPADEGHAGARVRFIPLVIQKFGNENSKRRHVRVEDG